GFTALFTWLSVYNWDKTDPAQRAQVAADPVGTILGAGFYLGQLTVCVLGVLVISAEYTTGVIRASLMAVPRRYPMFLATAVVFRAGRLRARRWFSPRKRLPGRPRARPARRPRGGRARHRRGPLPARARLFRDAHRRPHPPPGGGDNRRDRFRAGAGAAGP